MHAGIGHFAQGQVGDPRLEVAKIGVHRADQQLVAQHPVQVDLVGRNFDRPLAAGDARPHHDAVVAEDLHRLERDGAAAGRFDDQIGLADLLRPVPPAASPAC